MDEQTIERVIEKLSEALDRADITGSKAEWIKSNVYLELDKD